MDERIITLLEEINQKMETSNSLKERIIEKLESMTSVIEEIKGVGTDNSLSDVCEFLDDIEREVSDYFLQRLC